MLQKVIYLAETEAKPQVALKESKALAFSLNTLKVLDHLKVPLFVSSPVELQGLDSSSLLRQILAKARHLLLVHVFDLFDLILVPLSLCAATY